MQQFQEVLIPADAVKGTVSVKFVPDNSKLSTIDVDVKAQTDGSYSFSNVSINSSSNIFSSIRRR